METVWKTLAAAAVLACLAGSEAFGQRPSTAGHVAELAAYLDRVEIAEPISYGRLAVYPVLVPQEARLRGHWLTLDEALSRGTLLVREKGSGNVPTVIVENRSRDDYVFLMAGEIISGGMQTRTVRRDVVLAPRQRVDLDVFCVEHHRWEGAAHFSAGKALVPQSIQKEMRKGADQSRVWSEVARNNAALRAENRTGSLETALKDAKVADRLGDVRRHVLPEVPQGATGFIFVADGRALGAEFFGREELARQLLPKLLDAYAVDFVLIDKEGTGAAGHGDNETAIVLFKRVCQAGSQRNDTPGSGAGIRTHADRLVGDGVSLDGTLVHYGAQVEDRLIPEPVHPGPRPHTIWPQSNQ
jgi:hypothetical protein